MRRRDTIRAAIAGLAALITSACATSRSIPTATAPAPGHATSAPATPAPAVTDSATTVDPDGVLPTVTAAADPAAVTTATRFVQAWARPDLPARQWLAAVRPHAIPAYADLLATVDPANVPATKVIGGGRAAAATANRVDVAGVLRVICVRSGPRWLVATLGMREEAAAR